ncbi:MAG: class I SAM-dependent methyltransferase [Bacteroidetes bacterium]|nr:class I SAM-dependent methyltransferase [Bacteroidota bacterium]
MTDKSILVKELFENTALYLTYDYNLRIRKETVDAYTEGKTFDAVLDMPCGTGAMSRSLLDKTKKLSLVDISANMLAIASENIPETQRYKTECINDDFFKLDIPPGSYDLVICLGLLAHVNSPEQLLRKISGIIKPGGMLIIQNTDASHFYSHLIRFYLGLKGLIRKQPYKLNKVKASFLEQVLHEEGFRREAAYRYNQSFLGFSNLFSNEKKYELTRRFFGDTRHNKHASWGSDYTYCFVKRA